MKQDSACYVGIDWGSSSFRAYRFDEQYQLLDTIEAKTGIKQISDGAFEESLFSQIGHWVHTGDTILLSGMITSRNGWVETPYVCVPVAPHSLLAQSVKRCMRDINLIFLPGMSQTEPRADVLRGEELQLFGVSQTLNNALVVLPGTHSKWVQVRDGAVVAFQTIVTGELFDALLHNTLIGALATNSSLHNGSFEQGVKRGFASTTLVSELFHCRSGVLLKELDGGHVHSYLSGLLIGNEISEAAKPAAGGDILPVVLVGSDALCEQYQQAFSCLKIDSVKAESATTSKAFAQLLSLL